MSWHGWSNPTLAITSTHRKQTYVIRSEVNKQAGSLEGNGDNDVIAT